MSIVWNATEPRPDVRWDVTDDEYYADHSAASQSALKVYLESPILYRGRFITGEFPREETPALSIGKALHCAVLDPDKFAGAVAVAPVCNRRTNEGKALYSAFCERAFGKIALSDTDYSSVLSMNNGIQRNPLAKMLLEKPRETEIAFRWHDEESGLDCKAKLDGLVNEPEASYCMVLDLKSTKDPTPDEFPKSIVNYGYDIQAAQYCTAATLYTGRSAAFVIIAVRNAIPWDCFVYRLENEWMTAATRRLAEGMKALADAYRNDYWFAPGQETLQTLSPPGWARERSGL